MTSSDSPCIYLGFIQNFSMKEFNLWPVNLEQNI